MEGAHVAPVERSRVRIPWVPFFISAIFLAGTIAISGWIFAMAPNQGCSGLVFYSHFLWFFQYTGNSLDWRKHAFLWGFQLFYYETTQRD
jgi:hypothetical protein